MKTPPMHPLETARQQTVDVLQLNVPGAEASYSAIVNLLADALQMPITLFSVIDGERQFFKANVGLGANETPRDISFCGHAIVEDQELMVVEDAKADPRFADNPLVLGNPDIRFYAGAVVHAPNNLPLGTVCAIDRTPRKFGPRQREQLLNAKLLMESAILLRSQSIKDHLTGLYNRRHFDAYLESEWRRAYRHTMPMSLLLLDVDHFKQYNDRLGHPAGDRCLQQVAAAAAGALTRAGDLIARYGGEEFVAVLPATNAEAATRIGESIREAVAALKLEHPGSGKGHVTVSVGGATALDKGIYVGGPAALLAAADEALYEAKESGRDRCIVRAMQSASSPP